MSFLRELLAMQFSRCLVGSSGLEPPTSRLSGVRSNLLSYEPLSQMSVRLTAPILPFRKVGGDERVRTDDPLLAKQVLSQLSYTPILCCRDILFSPEPQKLNNDAAHSLELRQMLSENSFSFAP